MAFAFNLDGNDIDLDESEFQEPNKAHEARPSVQESAPPVRTYTICDEHSQDDATSSLLKCLPSSITYEFVDVPNAQMPPGFETIPIEADRKEPQTATTILRRPTYDILLQLKAEADAEKNQNAELISAMEGTDRKSGVYEGGLKTWEGALDLATLVTGINFSPRFGNWHIVELGAGSAIPSMVALKSVLAVKTDAGLAADKRRFHFTLSDYNDEVLRLSTFANLLLITRQEFDRRQRVPVLSLLLNDGSLDVDEELISECQKLWREAGVSFNFVSGPWGKAFDIATTASNPASQGNVLILASETIYDLKSLPTFTDTVMNLLRANGVDSRAWIAAKKLYFGVGGGVDAFVQEIEIRGGFVKEIMNTKQGVSRVVLEIRATSQTPLMKSRSQEKMAGEDDNPKVARMKQVRDPMAESERQAGLDVNS